LLVINTSNSLNLEIPTNFEFIRLGSSETNTTSPFMIL
jgi:hypothetical protein